MEAELVFWRRVALDYHGSIDKHIWGDYVRVYENDKFYATYLRYQEYRAGLNKPEYRVIREISMVLGIDMFAKTPSTYDYPIKLSKETLEIFKQGNFKVGEETAQSLYTKGKFYMGHWFLMMQNKKGGVNSKILEVFNLLNS